MRLLLPLVLLPLAAAVPPSGLDEIRKEPDALRRFERALELMDSALASAHVLIRQGGSRSELSRLLDEISASAQLSIESLRATGRRPSKLGRQYKKGEMKLREAGRLLNDMAQALSVEERPAVEKARDLVDTFHEEFLLGVMSK